jgi:hypothetical protein
VLAHRSKAHGRWHAFGRRNRIDRAKHAQQRARAHILQVQPRTLQAVWLPRIVMSSVMPLVIQVLGLDRGSDRIARSRRTTVGGLGSSTAASLEQRRRPGGQSRSSP